MARKQINANIEEERWTSFKEICDRENLTCNKALADFIDKVVDIGTTKSSPQDEQLLLKYRQVTDELLEKRLQLLETKVAYLEKVQEP